MLASAPKEQSANAVGVLPMCCCCSAPRRPDQGDPRARSLARLRSHSPPHLADLVCSFVRPDSLVPHDCATPTFVRACGFTMPLAGHFAQPSGLDAHARPITNARTPALSTTQARLHSWSCSCSSSWPCARACTRILAPRPHQASGRRACSQHIFRASARDPRSAYHHHPRHGATHGQTRSMRARSNQARAPHLDRVDCLSG